MPSSQCPVPPGITVTHFFAEPVLLFLALGLPVLATIMAVFRRRAWPNTRIVSSLSFGGGVILVGYALSFGVVNPWSDALSAWADHLVDVPGCYTLAVGQLLLWIQYAGAALLFLGLLVIGVGEAVIVKAINAYALQT